MRWKSLLLVGVFSTLFLLQIPATGLCNVFYKHALSYWWVESGTGCGAVVGEQPHWLFTTSKEVVNYYTGGSAPQKWHLWHHNYTVPSTNIDAWRITLDSDVCPTTSAGSYEDWRWRDCNTSPCTWNTNMDYEGHSVSRNPTYGYYTCRYYGEAKTSMCNRTMSNYNNYTFWGHSYAAGYNYAVGRNEWLDDTYMSPPAL